MRVGYFCVMADVMKWAILARHRVSPLLSALFQLFYSHSVECLLSSSFIASYFFASAFFVVLIGPLEFSTNCP